MEKKLMMKIAKKFWDNLLALYDYEVSINSLLPIFILKSVDFLCLKEIKKDLASEKFIIFTNDDIVNWADSFALKFLHMKNHSELIIWENVFENINIEKKHLRANLELEVRNKLIQLREWYLSYEWNRAFLWQILSVMFVMREGILYLNDETIVQSQQNIMKKAEWLLACNWDFFQDLLRWKKYTSDEVPGIVEKVNEYLIVLRSKIDSYTL